MNSVVVELQRDALDRQVTITELLRKAFVVARKLGIGEFEKWVTQELNGYENVEDIPQYRNISGVVRAWNPCHGWQPVFFANNEMEKLISNRSCGQAIAEIESLLGADSESGTLQVPFSADVERKLQKAIGFQTQITLIVPTTSLVRIVDNVRTVILNWAMKLEEDQIVGEGLSFTGRERETAGKSSYNINNFYGPVQSPQIQQQASKSFQVSSVHQYDISSVKDFLTSVQKEIEGLDLSSEAKQELTAETETAKIQAGSPKPKHSIIRESLLSIRTILEGAGGAMAAQLLMKLGALLG